MSIRFLALTLGASAAVLCAAATLTGCSAAYDAPQPDRPGRTTLAVEVTDAGFAGKESRTYESEWKTVFTPGDRIGLYIVRDEMVMVENLCLTLDENGEWTPESGDPLYYEAGREYFAYYPWQADMAGKIDAASHGPGDFFLPLIRGWVTALDQSTHDAYTASDLMTGWGEIDALRADKTRPLTLYMMHRMTVAAIELPGTKYTTPDGFTYAAPSVEAAFTWGGEPCKPYRRNGVYRLIYNTSARAEIAGSYQSAEGTRLFGFDPVTDRGVYRSYLVDDGLRDGGERALKPGDLYYADGSILPVEKAAALPSGSVPRGCIGIVFQTDPSRISEAEKRLFTERGQTLHGVAISLKAADGRGGELTPIRGTSIRRFPGLTASAATRA